MFRLTKKVEYALKGLYYLGVVRQGERIGVAELSEALELPRRFVEQIFLQLRKAGLLVSYRGAHGGYEIAGDFETMTLGQVLDALDEQADLGSGFGSCGEDRFVRMVNESLASFLRELNLDELVTQRMRDLVKAEGEGAFGRMYYI